jgi:small GTP-binding protein
MTEPGDARLMKKVCMLGSPAVGKTSLVRRFVESIFDDRYLTTVGVKIDRKRVTVSGKEMSLVLWDLSGDDELAQPKPSHLRGASGYILVADGCRRVTAQRAIAIEQRATSISGPVPVVVALNKADVKPDWEIGGGEIEELGQKGWRCLYTSAKTGDGVEALFHTLAEQMWVEMHDEAGR